LITVNDAGDDGVEVIYAEAGKAWRLRVDHAVGGTVAALLLQMPDLARGWPVAAFTPAAVAVFGREVDAATVLRDGDRLELLRALPNDPKLARRARAGR
jgi:putative ubiquitin-RnfH superfamily antitoxin RatB of RatAB toxin-antitoxin module